MKADLFETDMITEEQKTKAELAIKEKQKNSDFDIREFPVDVIVEKYTKKIPLIGNVPELYMPDYQREYKWSIKQQSEFIESVMIDLPIPYVYVADVSEGENEGRLEIIDGSQRIRTISRFLNNLFALEQLTLIPELNGFKFKDLTGPRQLRFQRKTIRFIELLDVDEEARRQIFYRLNSGGTKLKDMEVRYGTNDGEFLDFIKTLAQTQKFRELCPISKSRIKNREYEEMILRFFAYRFDMDSYVKKVSSFLTDFMDKMNGKYKYQDNEKTINFDKQLFQKTFDEMLNFVESHYQPLYFKKTINNTSVPRIRFEALSVGTSLALATGRQINTSKIKSWLESDTFSTLTDSDASNSIPKLRDRTYFVTNNLLGDSWEPTSTSFQKILEGKSPVPFLEQDDDEAEAGIDGDQYVLF
ncbi:DUF262 domain-containing protein [Acinetobacter baumannii]|uniref:DUF262 domain-containing protein n=1 Tax=Acinetobacter calcoaceticus/baumannii complex TaxID=909768 RepID=UPI001D196272|nr:DUF262 domain-containing protein [Acinetobacter baumannii]MDC5046805.1 DUF262 domain-containing protein [Acinetobacter baumannii]